MRVLVTGLGSHLCDARLAHERFKVVGADVTTPGLTVEGRLDAVAYLACPASHEDYGRLQLQRLRIGSVGAGFVLDIAQQTGRGSCWLPRAIAWQRSLPPQQLNSTPPSPPHPHHKSSATPHRSQGSTRFPCLSASSSPAASASSAPTSSPACCPPGTRSVSTAAWWNRCTAAPAPTTSRTASRPSSAGSTTPSASRPHWRASTRSSTTRPRSASGSRGTGPPGTSTRTPAGRPSCSTLIVKRFRGLGSLVVASSMSVYGEGLHTCEEHGAVSPGLCSDAQSAAHDWTAHCPWCDREVSPVPTPEDEPLLPSSVHAS